MPEGPELYLASKFINSVCSNRIFGGAVIKSEVSKQSNIEWKCASYKICSKSRGKEIMLTLTEVSKDDIKPKIPPSTSILFHFGMSGIFKFTTADEIPKHSHLRFLTAKEVPQMALNFVDVRRFGSWSETQDWSPDRGPDPVSEYKHFRENVLARLDDPAFRKPICEALLNQKYFNGIGNYLRAEIIYRAGVRPFDEARSVLEHLPASAESKVKIESPDILQLCSLVPKEVIALDVESLYDPSTSGEVAQPFLDWIRCYNKPEMKKMLDHNKRTIWFTGEAGPLAPKNASRPSLKKKKTVSKDKKLKTEETDSKDKKLKTEETISKDKKLKTEETVSKNKKVKTGETVSKKKKLKAEETQRVSKASEGDRQKEESDPTFKRITRNRAKTHDVT